MSDVQQRYFDWLIARTPTASLSYERLALMLHRFPFRRNVGYDMNRADQGTQLRRYFIDEYSDLDLLEVNDLMAMDCTWFEMLLALSETLDFYYDGGVKGRFIELITNMGLKPVLFSRGVGQVPDLYGEVDMESVRLATRRVDENLFDANGHGGLFPLSQPPRVDQREVEIWDQAAAYFRERLEGDLGLLQIEN